MRIGILGAGAIAFGCAAYLARAGHTPVIWSPSGTKTAELAVGNKLRATSAIEGEFEVGAARDCEDAVATSDAVLIALPAYGHRAVMDAAIEHLRPGQPVIISSHTSFGALYLSKLLAARGLELPIIVWGTTVTTGRQKSLTEVNVATVREKVDVATLPASAIDAGWTLCTQLFGDRFVKRDGMLAISLSNLNPQNHLGIAMLNLTRMEKGEVWGQGEHVTPAVGRLIEALDEERLAIAGSFGLKVRTVYEHFSLSFHVPMASVSEMNQEMHRQGRGGFGPTTIESRYILEDAPFGLWPTALLGRISGHPASLHEAGVAIYSAAYGRDLKADNDLLPELGLEGIAPEELKRLCEQGFAK
ncbi:NAD/NADP octopine/nopaline dehydrogenase family protein [Phyllobacterium sp. 0TCS1.6C]|uniref:NAD/NADP-dependent octopine/nopaline dehydrogenase family protein n=1 Tax=unclassified Phyllobacterium TaxID=2638441 RepID=UPI0022640CA0|nr:MULTISPECIES: NAD/NADP-dependent octopine/nopaline dehydrogenase family protein [unclassified Phyllobacterium]MCX8280007.1 NAD/NADP octopine/nopaline dehydrogenase family protein [Phyllobacterium sp. 0TCS1.6C]MCX8296174.1 NAD/NADP octopine/nopaline dehydrogenase family protein [Phyllobacterium sp. 0TCS1.6A]